ncbi:MAG: OmpA family protein [Phycisphaerales bacterium]|nr:OmpA family protein [Phycisphaerales bacterium]
MKRLVLVALVAVSGLFSGGCQSNKDPVRDQMQIELQGLRDRVNAMEQRVAGMQAVPAPAPVGMAGGGEVFNEPGVTVHGGPGAAQVYDVAGDVLFASGSASIRSTARRSLDRIAQQLNGQWAGNRIKVVGHTDSDPIRRSKWPSNDALSMARAQAVLDYLAGKGVDRGRMLAQGLGSSEPKATKAASRRVEIVVLSR